MLICLMCCIIIKDIYILSETKKNDKRFYGNLPVGKSKEKVLLNVALNVWVFVECKLDVMFVWKYRNLIHVFMYVAR